MLSASDPARPAKRRRLLRDIGFFLLVVVALQFWQGREMQAGTLPPIAGRLADSRPISLEAALREAGGRPLLLYVWSESCPICRAEEGTIASIAEDWPVLTLAMQSGNAEAVAKFMRERDLAYPALVDARGEIAWSLGVRATPAWFIVDRNRLIRFSGLGYTTGWGLRARLWWTQQGNFIWQRGRPDTPLPPLKKGGWGGFPGDVAEQGGGKSSLSLLFQRREPSAQAPRVQMQSPWWS